MTVALANDYLRRKSTFSPGELRFLQVIEIGLGVTAPLWLYVLLFPPNTGYVRGLILVPLLVAVNLFLGERLSRTDPFLRRVFPVAYLAKFAAGGVYIF